MITQTHFPITFRSLLLLVFITSFSCTQTPKEIELKPGMVINKSVTIKAGDYFLSGNDSLDQPVVTIEGENITVDFNGAVLSGSDRPDQPNLFTGTGILIKSGKNIHIKNAIVKGFKVGLMATNIDSLQITESNFSYNYRQRLKSIREREDLSDWMSYHNNDKDEWLRYGAALYLKGCNHAMVKSVEVTGGQNGLLLVNCNQGLFYNNNMSFNSGLGIGMYRSSDNRVMNNKLDWCIRGYSHGFYNRGQDSSGILIYEQSNNNTFAHNSATHGGDGFFLWAGQTTMDTGKGGCNHNHLYLNDFSYASNNGVEMSFSKGNKVIRNRMTDCDYGIWGGYSYESLISQNTFVNNNHDIAFEHGNNNKAASNKMKESKIGIQLWARDKQPADWGFANKRDVSSRDTEVTNNTFDKVKTPLHIKSTKGMQITKNQFAQFQELLKAKDNEDFQMTNNRIYQNDLLGDAYAFRNDNELLNGQQIEPLALKSTSHGVIPLPDGMDAKLPESQLKGKQYIIVNEWGPYDFRRPIIALRTVDENKYTFALFGPQGNWKVVDGQGFTSLSAKTGAMPATLVVERSTDDNPNLNIQLEFIGETTTNQFGQTFKKGTVYPFSFSRYEKAINWTVRWYTTNDKTHPVDQYANFKQLKEKEPEHAEQVPTLHYSWWESPGGKVHPDRFATFAQATVDMTPGEYEINITSDDGLRFYIDGKLLIDHWDIHVPANDVVKVKLSGKHLFEVEHFEGGGFATLGFTIQPMKK